MSRLFKQAANERGATLVENVVVLPIFLAVLIVSFDMLLLSLNVLTLRYSSARVMREASLGDLNAAQIRTVAQRFSGSLGLHLPDEYISMCRLADYPCQPGVIDTGERSELMVLELRAPLRGVFLGMASQATLMKRVLEFRARTIGRREP